MNKLLELYEKGVSRPVLKPGKWNSEQWKLKPNLLKKKKK
jgi:hypothetical protein